MDESEKIVNISTIIKSPINHQVPAVYAAAAATLAAEDPLDSRRQRRLDSVEKSS